MPRNPDSGRRQGRQHVLTPEEIRKIHELREAGETFRAIGDLLEINHVTVYWGYRLGRPNGTPLAYSVPRAGKTP
jgi:hypothetical protein